VRSKDANTPQFDFIYIDADKANYSQYFDLIIDNKLLAENGFMLIDNCLWKGEVVSATTGALTPAQTSKQAKTLMRFNEKVSADVRVEKVMLPLRDGLFMLRWA
jgi:caffeoyl-CoA O-methyltransferase